MDAFFGGTKIDYQIIARGEGLQDRLV
jgi:hypothetical protein